MNFKVLCSKIKKYLLGYLYIPFGRIFSIDDKTIMFFTFQGQYTCNPKYICDSLHDMDNSFKFIWVTMNNKNAKFPEYVTTVEFASAAYFKALYTSKVLVDNAFNFPKAPFKKKAGQYYVETMHGSLGIKRIEPDSTQNKRRNGIGYECGRMSDFIISNSTFEDNVYRTSFWPETPIVTIGHARNDILVSPSDSLKKELNGKVRKHYNLADDVKLAMYAPTFLRESSKTMENIDLLKLKDILETKFGGTWYILNRLHPRDSRRANANNSSSEYILDGNSYADIQELMVALDFGITDYSSWIYDYVLTNKPGMIYAPDLKEYESSTGFYYPIRTTPFPVAENNDDVDSCIKNMDIVKYQEDVRAFVADKGCVDDGNAAKKAATMIVGLLSDKKPL